MPTDHLPEPWKSFPAELDKAGSGEVFLHCIGGFVITQMYGLSRPTIDIDAITITPSDSVLFFWSREERADRCIASTDFTWIS